ncbi:hypothetical protein B0H12DRAFT_961723, partial [Mycena haematopus]
MSPERRNELLAKGLCFTCEEPGHLARNCPKTMTVTSKNKGKPPGIRSNSVTIPYDLIDDPETDPELLPSETDSEWSTSELEAMSPLKSASDSETSDNLYDSNRDTFEGRLRLWERASIERDLQARDLLPRAHRIGDIMGASACSLLEFLQPYPGDERVPWSDERRDGKRFRITRVSRNFYEIDDVFTGGVTILPLAFLRVPHFQIARWYSGHLAQEMEL